MSKIRETWRRIVNAWPLVWRTQLQANIEAYNKSQLSWNESVVAERQRADEAYGLADVVIRRISRLCWERNGPYYAVRVEFDTRMVAGVVDRREMKFLAECIGRQVEAEIAASRFVQEARVQG